MKSEKPSRSEQKGVIPDALLLSLFARLKPQTSIALAVSGGPDSMALMHLTRRWCGLAGYDPRKISILTVDHGLRPESRREADFVAAQAKLLSFSHTILNWSGKKPATGIQDKARAARYRLMAQFCNDTGIPCLVTGHTQDDQAETLLMRLRRGSGLDGLASIPPMAEREGVVLIRPFLRVSKARLLAYMRAESIGFLHDPSNDQIAFERVRLRVTMKTFERAGIRRQALAQSAWRLHRVREALDHIVANALHEFFRIDMLGYGEIERTPLDAQPEEIVLRVYSQALDLIGGDSEPARLVKLERLLELRTFSHWRATLGGCVIIANPHCIQVFREFGRMKSGDHAVGPAQETVWDRRYILRANEAIIIRPLGPGGWSALSQARKDGSQSPKVPHIAALTTPSVWIEGRLAAAPLLKWTAPEFANNAAAQIEIALAPELERFLKPS